MILFNQHHLKKNENYENFVQHVFGLKIEIKKRII